MDDEELLTRAEQALTEIKVNQGLSEHHAAVLVALRIRLKGSAGGSLEEMLEAADDTQQASLEEKLAGRVMHRTQMQEPPPAPPSPGAVRQPMQTGTEVSVGRREERG